MEVSIAVVGETGTSDLAAGDSVSFVPFDRPAALVGSRSATSEVTEGLLCVSLSVGLFVVVVGAGVGSGAGCARLIKTAS